MFSLNSANRSSPLTTSSWTQIPAGWDCEGSFLTLLRVHYHHPPSCLAGARPGRHNVCLLHPLELQDDSHPGSRPSGPQQTRPPLCHGRNAGISTLFSHRLVCNPK